MLYALNGAMILGSLLLYLQSMKLYMLILGLFFVIDTIAKVLSKKELKDEFATKTLFNSLKIGMMLVISLLLLLDYKLYGGMFHLVAGILFLVGVVFSSLDVRKQIKTKTAKFL